jgi:TonB family protein
MNPAALEPATWNARRWLFSLALIFLAQLLLIYLLSARQRAVNSPAIAPTMKVHLFTGELAESEFSETFLASDPTLFAVASPHSFSTAWLKAPKRNYNLSERTELPYWLALNSEMLGKSVTQFVQTNLITPTSVQENPEPKILAATIPGSFNVPKSNSVLHIEGNLTSSILGDLPQLESQPHTVILSNSVVQVTVDPRGTVVSARLLARSGSADADRSALETAGHIQFAPNTKNETILGKLIFDWHTVPSSATNSTNGTLPSK